MSDFIERTKLTERTVAQATPATNRSKGGHAVAKYYFDTELQGFGLSVSFPSEKKPHGSKSYFVMRRVQNRQERHVFGKANQLSVDEARKKAAKLLTKMDDGISLNEERRKARVEAARAKVKGITLGQALKLYQGTLRSKERSVRTMEGYKYFVDRYLTAWVERPLAEITRSEVRKRHADISKEIARGKYTTKARGPNSGKTTANHVMRAFRAIYNRAMRENEELPVNPTINVDFNVESRRQDRIPEAGMKEWYDRVQALTNTVRRDYLLFALFTGLRRENAAEVMWDHVDFERRVLHVPKPKSGRPFDLPLSDFLVALMKGRQEDNKVLAPDSDWVFPAARGEGHIVEVRLEGSTYTVKAARKKGEVKPRYKTHDLRRTFASIGGELHVPERMLRLLMNHKIPKSDVHGGYHVPEIEQLRGYMQQITVRMLVLCKPVPRGDGTKVVPIRKKVEEAVA
jgi:integrase